MMGKASEILGSISPLYGIISGKGLFGKLVGGGDSEAKNIKDEIEERRQQAGQRMREQGDKKFAPQPARAQAAESQPEPAQEMKRGGSVKSKVSSASKRADGIAQRGKTRGKFV
jgi:hypothetical protein